MPKAKLIAAMMLPVMSAACATPHQRPALTASALCLIDRELPVNIAPGPNVNDPGNKFDTDETADRIDKHNARLRAACPKE